MNRNDFLIKSNDSYKILIDKNTDLIKLYPDGTRKAYSLDGGGDLSAYVKHEDFLNGVIPQINFEAVKDYSTTISSLKLIIGTNEDVSPEEDILQINFGISNTLSGALTYAHGYKCKALSVGAVALGYRSQAIGLYSHSLGFYGAASGAYSHVLGSSSQSVGLSSHALGKETSALGKYSHTLGWASAAYKLASHALGLGGIASGLYSHALGQGAKSIGIASHALGNAALAKGDYSHALGNGTLTEGANSHSEGLNTRAFGLASHALGNGTIANGFYQHAEGKYNIEDLDLKYQHIVGNGTYSARSNIQTLDWDGNLWNAGDVSGYVDGTLVSLGSLYEAISGGGGGGGLSAEDTSIISMIFS